jgi:lipopolysaccharide biosynthesis glycosyltransferase
MNLVMCADDNYAPLLGVSIYSILKNNKTFNEINFYILDANISSLNKLRIETIVNNFNSKIEYINTEEIDSKIQATIKTKVKSLSTYYRVFLTTLLSERLNKIIYMDCDSIVCSDLKELWDTNIEDYHIAGVLDVIPEHNKLSIGLKENDSYFNAGMLLINIEKWRQDKIESKMIAFINSYNGAVRYHDQGIINGVCQKKMILHPKFNVLTPFFVMSKKQIIHYHQLNAYDYSESEISEAKNQPVFVHFVPFLTDRPWVKGNFHPLKYTYNSILNETPWKGLVFKKRSSTLEPFVKWLFMLFPYEVFIFSLNFLRKLKIRTWLRSITSVN